MTPRFTETDREGERKIERKRQSQTISRITRMNHQNYQSCSSGGKLANIGELIHSVNIATARYTEQIKDTRYKSVF